MTVKRKLTSLLIAVLVLGAVLLTASVMNLFFSYPITDLDHLESDITDAYNRGRSVSYSPHVQIHSSVTLDDTTYILIELDEDLGRVVLERNILGRYKIAKLGYGGGNFREGVVEHGGKKYLLYGGRNLTQEIVRITCTLNGYSYTMDLPEAPRFLVCTEISPLIEDTHVSLDQVWFYDAQGNDITANYDLGGGGM